MSRLQIASLVAPRRTFVSGGPHGYSPRWELVSFAWRQARATLVPPGLLRRVHRELKNSAQEVEVVPKPMRPQLFGNAEALQELAPEDRRLIESIHGDACGLVATCDRLSVIGVIDVVTRAFPAARLLIVTKHPSQAARLCKQLRRSLGIDVAVHARAPVCLPTGAWSAA